jgi:hypothetical protein
MRWWMKMLASSKVGNAMRKAYGYMNFEHLSIALYTN